jgi:curli biogenesis system outer membrane secretion channel CsgG
MFCSLGLIAISTACSSNAPVVDSSPTSKALEALARKTGTKKIVTIYEFRTSVPEVLPRAATDMFTTALMKSGAFAVAERQRLNEGVMREKQLNASVHTSGDLDSTKLAVARIIFEGTISEAMIAGQQNEFSSSAGGVDISLTQNQDTIGIDVRVIEAQSGLVLDAVNVRRSLQSSDSKASATVSGAGGSAVLKQFRSSIPGGEVLGTVAIQARIAKKESIDRALRECIELAVLELVRRYGQD